MTPRCRPFLYYMVKKCGRKVSHIQFHTFPSWDAMETIVIMLIPLLHEGLDQIVYLALAVLSAMLHAPPVRLRETSGQNIQCYINQSFSQIPISCLSKITHLCKMLLCQKQKFPGVLLNSGIFWSKWAMAACAQLRGEWGVRDDDFVFCIVMCRFSLPTDSEQNREILKLQDLCWHLNFSKKLKKKFVGALLMDSTLH